MDGESGEEKNGLHEELKLYEVGSRGEARHTE